MILNQPGNLVKLSDGNRKKTIRERLLLQAIVSSFPWIINFSYGRPRSGKHQRSKGQEVEGHLNWIEPFVNPVTRILRVEVIQCIAIWIWIALSIIEISRPMNILLDSHLRYALFKLIQIYSISHWRPKMDTPQRFIIEWLGIKDFYTAVLLKVLVNINIRWEKSHENEKMPPR